MSEIIKDKNGNLFPSQGVTQNFIRLKKFKTHAEPVEHEGGWAVKLYAEGEAIVDEPVKNEQTTIEKQTKAPEPIAKKVVASNDNYDIYDDDDEATKNILLNGEYQPVKNAYDIIEPFKDKRFRYRWANPKNKQETRIEELRAQGWQIDPVMKGKIAHLVTYKEQGTSVGTTTMIRGKLLMRMPQHMADQRNKNYRDMANSNLVQEQETLKEATGGQLYGGINVSKG